MISAFCSAPAGGTLRAVDDEVEEEDGSAIINVVVAARAKNDLRLKSGAASGANERTRVTTKEQIRTSFMAFTDRTENENVACCHRTSGMSSS
jgi:hypothetical protein